MTRTTARLWCSALFVSGLGAASVAQIKSFTLDEMVRTADQAVDGQIIGSKSFRVDSPDAGPELYYTTITIQGRTLQQAQPITVDVTFRGGFVSETEGVFNSEAPAADDVKLGKRVIAFYRWADDMGGGVPANALVAAHGGLYRVVDGPRGATVLGRGAGYAIAANRRVEHLESAVRLIKR
ncbi:MAG: hypothetical protein L0206_25790 [Actinobacteria bacterium]|nr:hypothetical protein [Actinomycetota bacterium]